jgi:hypothetical protein
MLPQVRISFEDLARDIWMISERFPVLAARAETTQNIGEIRRERGWGHE